MHLCLIVTSLTILTSTLYNMYSSLFMISEVARLYQKSSQINVLLCMLVKVNQGHLQDHPLMMHMTHIHQLRVKARQHSLEVGRHLHQGVHVR